MEQRIFPGTWCDIARQGDGILHVCALPNGEVYYRSVSQPDGPPVVHQVGHSLLFLRADGTTNGHILVTGKAQGNGHAYYAIDGGTPTDLGLCHGIHPVDVTGRADDWKLSVVRQGRVDTYEINQFGTHTLVGQKPTGTTQGFLNDGLLADEFRDSVTGLAYPFQAGGYAVGQNGGPDPARLRVSRLHDGKLCACYVGYAQRPNAAFLNGRLYVAAWVGHGSLFQEWDPAELAWGNDTIVAPPPPPPVPPDVPWRAEPNRTVDMLTFVRAAATQVRERPDGTGDLWLHKSTERDNWGENWDWDRDYIGFVEDRSTGTRMVSQERPKRDNHTNTRRNRMSPEDIVRFNAEGHNFGDYRTLPLAGYTWRGNRVWMPRHVTGTKEVAFKTDYVWWDLPEFGGIWEVWKDLPVTARVETGYARFNGHDVFARSLYGKARGGEWNYWGPHGWIAFRSYDEYGREEAGTASTKPAGAGPSPLTAPFVEARFVPTQPIYRAAVAPPPPPVHPPVGRPVSRPDGVGYLELRDLEARLEDTYRNHGGHPALTRVTHVNPEGEIWREHYFTRRQKMAHEPAIRSIESQIDTIEGRPDRWASVAPPPRPGPLPGNMVPRLQGLRVDGRYWVDDHGPQAPLGISMLYALDGRDYLPFLNQVGAKVQFVRVFAGYLSPVPGSRNELLPEQALERLPALLDALAIRGLAAEVVALTDTAQHSYVWTEHVKAVARLLRGREAMLTLANEVQHSSQSPILESVLGDLMRAAQGEGFTGPIAFGANERPGSANSRKDEVDPGTGRYRTAGGTYNTVHLARTEPGWTWYHEACRMREQEFIQEKHGVPVSNDEPNRVEDTGDPRGFAFLMSCLAKGFGLATVFHSGQARDCQPLSGIQLEAFEEFVKGWTLLPTARYRFKNGTWGDSPVANASYVEGANALPGKTLWRTPSFLSDQGDFTLAIGPDAPNGVIEWQNGYRPAEPGSRRYETGNIYLIRLTR